MVKLQLFKPIPYAISAKEGQLQVEIQQGLTKDEDAIFARLDQQPVLGFVFERTSMNVLKMSVDLSAKTIKKADSEFRRILGELSRHSLTSLDLTKIVEKYERILKENQLELPEAFKRTSLVTAGPRNGDFAF